MNEARPFELDLPWALAPGQYVESILATTQQVNDRTEEMASEIIERYKGLDPYFIILMAGGIQFGSKLMFSVARQDPNFHPVVDYITISSYGSGTQAGELKLVTNLRPETIENHLLEDRPVIGIDDGLDLGNTAAYTQKHTLSYKARSFDLCVLVQKNNPRTLFPSATMFGFESPQGKWLSGMGLDNGPAFKEANRWFGAIAILGGEPESSSLPRTA